jgi:hypothetical protein
VTLPYALSFREFHLSEIRCLNISTAWWRSRCPAPFAGHLAWEIGEARIPVSLAAKANYTTQADGGGKATLDPETNDCSTNMGISGSKN